MILDNLEIDPRELERRTGWAIKPEGACKAGICVPLPASGAGAIDARILAERLAMPLIEDPAQGLWALGPEAGGKALASAVAPELTLTDFDGHEFSLSSLRGTKVLLLAWASW